MNDIFKMAEQAYHALSIAETELKRLYKENAELKNSLTKAVEQMRDEAKEGLHVDAVNMSQERVDETAKREHDLVYRLRKRAEIRRQIDTRKSVQEGKPDRIADLLEEAADYIEKREWVGLTEEDIDDIWKTEYFNLHYELPKAIEAKLKEKNCG